MEVLHVGVCKLCPQGHGPGPGTVEGKACELRPKAAKEHTHGDDILLADFLLANRSRARMRQYIMDATGAMEESH